MCLALILATVAPTAATANDADPIQLVFDPTGTLIEARVLHTATLLPDGTVVVVGGHGVDGPVAAAEVWDPATGSFSPAGSLAEARVQHTATLLPDGTVVVIGGAGGEDLQDLLGSVEDLDPASGTSNSAGALIEARSSHTATLLPDGTVLVIGGLGVGGWDVDDELASVEAWDPASGTSSPVGTLAEARWLHTATLLQDGGVLVIGGRDVDGWEVDGEVWDPASGTSSPVGTLAEARVQHTATLLPDGRVLVIGGVGVGGLVVASEVLDPASGKFSPAGALIEARSLHTATLLPDGRVLVIGGLADEMRSNVLASVEVWDPASGTFSPAGSLAEARAGHTATLLPDGTVLVVGGRGVDGLAAAAEIWDPYAQVIALGGVPPWVPIDASPLTVTVATNSGLHATLETRGACNLIDGPRLELLDVGECTVTATQEGEPPWKPATPVAASVAIVRPVSGEITVPYTSDPMVVSRGAHIHSILDPNLDPTHVYAVWLDAGEKLLLQLTDEPPGLALSVAGPDDAYRGDEGRVEWTTASGGLVATRAGVHLVRVSAPDDVRTASRYGLSLAVEAEPETAVMPSPGIPLSGNVLIGGQAASDPPGTPVSLGTTVTGFLTGQRPAVFELPLEWGDGLLVSVEGDVELHLAYPSRSGEWFGADLTDVGTWTVLASEAGSYSFRLTAMGEPTSDVSYRIGFESSADG